MIRKVNLNKDINQLIDITKIQFPKPRSKDFFLKYSDDFFYVLEEDKIKGFIIIQGRLLILITTKEKGKGIGKKLLDYAKDNFEDMWLRVRESNEAAIKFYENNGFVFKEKADSYYKNNENAIIMEWIK